MEPKRVQLAGPYGYSIVEARKVIQICKARDGKGTGKEVAFDFGQTLPFEELGVIVADARGEYR